MTDYHQAAVIQAGPHAICVAEPGFESCPAKYTMCFFIKERASSLGGCQSLAFTTAFRGIPLSEDIGHYVLRTNRKFTFEHFPAKDIAQEISIKKVYEDGLKLKYMVIFQTNDGDYGGFVKAKEDVTQLDEEEVWQNIVESNAFLLPNDLALLFVNDQSQSAVAL